MAKSIAQNLLSLGLIQEEINNGQIGLKRSPTLTVNRMLVVLEANRNAGIGKTLQIEIIATETARNILRGADLSTKIQNQIALLRCRGG